MADPLVALDQDPEALRAAVAAKEAADVSLELARRRWEWGYANYLGLLNAEQTCQRAVISLVQAQADRYSDTAALFRALGGGWWNRAKLSQD